MFARVDGSDHREGNGLILPAEGGIRSHASTTVSSRPRNRPPTRRAGPIGEQPWYTA